MSSQITNLRVLYTHTAQRLVYWDIISVEPGVKFYVERSPHPTDNFEEIAGPLNLNFYLDTNIPVIDRDVSIYYRIRIEDIGQNPVWTESVSLPFLKKPIAKAIIKEEAHFLKFFINRPIKIYIRKRWGERCPYCWDDIKKRVQKDKCPVCYSVGFKDGYIIPPILSYYQIENAPTASKPSPIGVQQINENRAWTSNYPILTQGDIIIDINEGTRYRINNRNFTTFQGFIIRQILDLHIINIGEIEYTLS